MSVEAYAKNLLKSGAVGAVAVVAWNGGMWYKTNNWDPSGPDIVNAFSNKQSVVVQNVKYSLMQATEDRYVAKNVQGSGSLVMAMVPPNKGLVVAWAPPTQEMSIAYTEVAKTAVAISKVI
ncbi:MAG: profilin family protein [Promethearchaeota archaeon]